MYLARVLHFSAFILLVVYESFENALDVANFKPLAKKMVQDMPKFQKLKSLLMNCNILFPIIHSLIRVTLRMYLRISWLCSIKEYKNVI